MARQDYILRYSGKLGNQIGYRRKKQYFVRQAPAVVRQTTATKRAAKDFGTASKGSRIIRHALKADLLHCYDSSLNNRLNKVLGTIVRADTDHQAGQKMLVAANMSPLLGFQFNEGTGIHQLLTDTPVIEKNDQNSISISLPEIIFSNNKSLRGITHFSIRAIALSVNFTQGTTRQQTSEAIVIKRGMKQPSTTLTLNTGGKEITCILLEVQSFYEMNGQLYPSQNKAGYALDIIAILPPVELPKEARREYRNKAPRLWRLLPYPQRVKQTNVILPLTFNVLPEG
jgi:hypothetical protein